MRTLHSVYTSIYQVSFSRRISQKWLFLFAFFVITSSLNAQLVIEGEITVDCACPADNDAFLDITVSGGTPPYTYLWTFNGSEVICSPRVDFSDLDGIGCAPSPAGQECSPDQSCSTPSDAINAQNFVIEDAVLTVGPPIAVGGACIDENTINDSTLDGFFAIRTGVSQLGNPGPAANVTRIWTFSNPVCDLQILLNDIDGEDAIIVNGKLNGVTIPLTADDFIITNTTPDPACPAFVGGNTWQSQNGCSSADNTDRGGILVTFPSCLDEIEFIYYDYTGGAGAGGSYAVGFSNICAADLQCIQGGLYQVEVTDANGAVNTAEFNVPDVSTPSDIVCPLDITTTTDVGACDAIVDWIPPVLEDGCPVETLVCTQDPGDTFPIGTTTVSCTATDNLGNISNCSFDITINYDSNPTLVCPADIAVNADAASCTATSVTWTPPKLSNDCDIATLTSNFDPGDDFPTGITTVNYTGTDSGGNTFNCSFDITVTNTGLPLILNCPNDITLTTGAGECDATATWTPPTPDPTCDATITSSSNNPGDVFPIGTTTVSYIVTDSNGATNTCNFDVTVTYNSNPTLDCPTDITVNAEVGDCVSSVTWTPPTLSNDCDITTLTSNFNPGDNFPAGTTTVTYTGTDPGGNVFNCSFDVTVINDAETIVLECPDDINLVLAAGECDATATWTPPVPDANCGATITGSNFNPGDTFPIGTTTVIYTATDISGNNFECSFDVTVDYDATPTLVCPVNIRLDADAGSCTATSVNWTPPTLSNDCSLTTLTGNFDPGDDFPTGTTTVTYTGTDTGGNTFNCSFDITIVNTGLPLILNCPDDIDIVAAVGQCDATATWTAPIPDPTCDATITSNSNNPGDTFPIGTTTVSYIVTDSNGATNTCNFDVTVTYNSNPTLDCPTDITVNAEVGDCVSSVTWTPPTLSNDCDITTLTSNFNPGDNFPAGTTTVTYTGTDPGGNVFNCSFDVTVINDAETIVLECPDDINLVLAAGECDATATWTPPVPDANCGATITGSNFNPGDTFPIGTTTVIYTATDISGNNFECSFDITINYNANPTLICPADVSVDADAGSCTATSVTWTAPTLSNDCSLTTLTSDFDSGDDFPTGTTTVTYTGTDTGGNVFECSFDVTVTNTGTPIILNCPDDIDLVASVGQCNATATWTPPTPDPTCDAVITSSSHDSGDTFPVGTTTVTYVITDGSGNTNTCSFDVTVNYDSNPVLVCPFDITVNAVSGTCNTTVAWILPSLSNSCNIATLDSDFSPGDEFPVGTTTVTYTATDAAGNTFECSFDVTIVNTGVPLILNCPDDVSVNLAPDACDAAVTWTPPIADPNCDAVITNASHNPGDTFFPGTTTVTYLITDGAGNTNTCSFDITVNYDAEPTLVCPANISINAEVGSCVSSVTWTPPTLSNSCNIATLTSNFDPGDNFPAGTTTVTYTATDPGGNVFECSFDVTVINDEETTVLDCPNDITLSTTPGQCDAIVSWTPPVPDANCNVTITGSTHEPGDAFPIGTTTVTYSATDPSGNIFECSFNITITYNSTPTLVCPADISVDADAGSCTATSVTWTPPTLSNDCDLTTLESNFEPGDDFPTGITTVIYTATDAAENVFECSFDVSVTNNGPPIIVNCPDNINVSTNIGECDAIAAWTPPTPDENCDALITSSSHVPGDVFPIGTTTVTYIATGPNGMTATCSFDVTVTYGQTPTLNCPQSITLDAFPGQCTTTITWTPPTLNSNCELVELNSDFEPGSAFPIGVTTVTYTATDAGGNVFECDFNITVNSNGPPPITNCPADITVNTNPGACDAIATWTPPMVEENCSATVTSNTHEPGDVFPIGTTTVTYIITDVNGLTNTCEFDVTVNYDSNPTLACPTGVTVNANPGACTATATWTPPTLSNDCELTTLTGDYAPGDVFSIGVTTVTYTGTDSGGNVFECSFDVTVIGDSETAVLICPDDITISVISGQCDIAVTWDEPVVDENCGVTLVGGDFSSGDIFPIGTTTVTYTVEDELGNTFECSFDITVNYSDEPSLVCPDDITVDALPGTCSSPVSWETPIFSSTCGLATLVGDYESGDALPIGTTTVTYVGTDSGGNIFECSFDVTVNSNGLGNVLTCPDDISLVAAPGACDAVVTWEPPVIDENCDLTITSSSHESGDVFPAGTTIVTYVAIDAGGTETTCSFVITIAYETNPTLICPENIEVETAAGECATVATWDAPTLSNDCTLSTVLSDYASGDEFPLGTTTVTLTATDPGGNVFECTFDVTVIGANRSAGLICPEDITTTVTPGQCNAAVTWEPPSPDENCGITLTGSNFEPGDLFPIGTTTVTYTAEDESGNTFDCSFDITVTYLETPSLICPQDITVDAIEGTCTSPITWAPPIFSSNCGLTTLVGNYEPGSEFPIGTTTVTYVGTDAAGNGFECSFDITVISNGPPVILNCPDNITVNTSPEQCDGTAAWVVPIVDENCDATITSSSHESGDTFPIGTTTVTYIATNTAGFQVECTFDVIVLYDIEPTLTCPANITVDAEAGECTTSVTWTPPTVLSNGCNFANLDSNFSPGDNFPAGTTTVTYTGTDEGGNVFECSFDVTVINDAETSVLECPFDITITAGAGQCDAVVIWTPPVPDESCGATITGSTHEPGDVFQIGTTTVIYTAEDESGNIFECSFDITIVYSELPTLTCPANITANADAGACTTAISWTAPTLSNNCNLSTLVSDYEPGDEFPTGITTVTYTGEDTGGNMFECSFDVTVINNGPPLILDCPEDISLVADAGLCEAIATWTPPVPDENCNATVTSSSHQPGDAFEIGTTTVSYVITDTNGNTNTCDFDITVVYSQIPTLVCPLDITIDAEENSCIASVTWTPPALSNNCNLVSLISSYEPGDDFPTGTTTVTYSGVDSGGNTFECNFDVTVVNNGLPVILNCPDNITLPTNSGLCEAVATWTPPVADENCDAIITNSSHNPGDIFPIGTTTVSYVVTDITGNTNTCSFDITVTYGGSPSLVCPGNISINADGGDCNAVVTWVEPTLSNDCNLTTINSNFNSGDNFPVGITTVNYTATDNAGTVFECSFDITVVDNEAPEITCPADISQAVDPSSCTAVVTWTPPVPTDNCAGVSVVSSSHEPGDIFNVGTTTVTYTVIDANDNIANCSFIVAVQDNEAPPIVCPESITVNSVPGACLTAVTWQEPVRPPSECLADSVVLISNFQSGDLFPVGVTTVEYTAVDNAGNIANCSFNVTVIDVEPPIITCQDDIVNIFTNQDECNAVVFWSLPLVTDNCDAMIVSSTHNSGDVFPIGTTTVIHTAEDAAGNSVSCSFDVIVTDKEDPVIACPTNITVSTDPGQCGAIVNWEIPLATDNCGATVSSNFQSGDFIPVGITLVTYTATDETGNIAECSFTITVNDNEPPVVTSCPENITVFTDPGECTAVVTWPVPLSVDNCQSASVGSTHVSGSIFPIGNTLVLYGILDESGNGNVCFFTITVIDNQEPVMECPSDITVFTDEGQCDAVVEWTVPAPFDNCGAEIYNSTHNPGEAFPVGTTTVTYTANDPTGAQVSCSFDVTVIDKQVPTIVCPADITINNTPGLCLAPVNWATPAVNDNCGVTSIVSTHSPGSLFPVGITTVQYTISDDEGNIAECTFNITVEDNEAPVVLECPSNITVSTDPGACNAAVTWNPPTAVDNCSSIISGSTHTPGALFPIGTTTVLYGILDGEGNGTTCVFTVTVIDQEPPTMNCPADITVFTDPEQCDAIVTWTPPQAIDNCEANIVSNSHTPDTAFPVGTTTVTYVAEDITGAQITCSFNITVVDKQDPTIVCPDDITATTNPGQCGSIVNWPLPEIDDNCGAVDISTSYSSGDFFPVGTTIVTYTVTDLVGNSTNCSFSVTVEDRQMPLVTNCPDDIVVTNDPGACNAVVTWDIPEFSDNCEITDVDSKPNPGSLFEIGITTVVYEVTDASGNTSTCTFTVTVEDTENPMLTCPADITVSNDEGACGAIVNWTPPVPIDNCGAEITGNTHNPGSFFAVGTTTVTYTTVNSEGVELTCSFDVTVEDREDPVLTCPADITVPFDNNSCEAIVTWNIGLADNCNAEITSSTHDSGDAFEYGTTTVTYTAEDDAGNSHICSFDVTVEDNEAPVILNCPEDLTAAGLPGDCEGLVIISTPQFGVDFTDCQENTTIVNDYNGTANASDIYPVGTTIVTWTVTDPAGNSVICEQIIIITPTDLTDDFALVTDKDVFVGANFDDANFNESDSILIFDPGIPSSAVVNTVILDFFFRPEGNSCERDVEVEITDPAGNVSLFPAPVTTCTGSDAIFSFILPIASVPTQASGGGTWKLRFRDTEDQNSVADGSPNGGSVPPGTEFSVRFGRINYDITVTPECEDGIIENDPPVDALPVELAYFKGTEEDCEAVLTWGTASEVNVSHFEIQRSYDGVSFSTIDRIDALGGEGIAANYTYADAQLTLTNYYRLEIVDNDGQVEYSDIFTIQAECANGVSISDIFPNPSMNQIINIRFNSNMDHEDAKVVVRDMLGRKMMEVPITVFLGSNLITVDPQRLPAASYFLVIEGAGWRSSSAKFVTLN